MIPLADLHPHPDNPRLASRSDVVDQIAASLNGSMAERHALTVRWNGDGYQVLSGHHRRLAAIQAGLEEVPCWIVEMDNETAYLELVRSNAQGELTALERGFHALRSGMDGKAYAATVGRPNSTVHREMCAARVVDAVPHVGNELSDYTRHLAELHAAAPWLWPALVAEMLRRSWTVKDAREKASGLAKATTREAPAWADQDKIATALVAGKMRVADIGRMEKEVDDAKLSQRLAAELQVELAATAPSSLSEVQKLVSMLVDRQEARNRKARGIRADRQKKREDLEAQRDLLLESVSLEQWKTLDPALKRDLLAGSGDRKRTFNPQENADIEWAMWSWNPVTGCLHDCPYCYARDIANNKRMEKVYPNGFAPMFRPRQLLAPRNMEVPGEATFDARHRNVFTCSMADLFGRWVPEEWINAVLREMRAAKDWNFLCLTKFPKRMSEFDIPGNVWMGTTVDLQARVAAAEAGFAKVKCAVKWLSIEPMLEPLTFTRLDLFDWVVVGGASRSSQTPAWHPPSQWVYDLRRQAENAGAAWYEKSNLWGSYPKSSPKAGDVWTARTMQLPSGLPVRPDQTSRAPDVFYYLGKVDRPSVRAD